MLNIPGYLLLLAGTAVSALALDPLARVEEDQAGGTTGSRDIFNRNIAMGLRDNYTRVSSYKPGAFGHLAHDGDARTAWIPHPGEDESFLEMSWGLAEPVNRVNILEKNSGGAPLSLELYDGSRWETVAHDDSLPRNQFQFPTRPASALRIRLANNGKDGGIAEVEVINTSSTAPLPRYGAADLVTAMQTANAVILFDGSPYAYSRAGRTLIQPRNPEACLTDRWTKPVIEFISASLGGKVKAVEPDKLQINLNGQSFTINTGPGTNITDQIKALAEGTGLEYLRQGSLVMVGQGLQALDQSHITSELADLLGRNPYYVSDAAPPDPNLITRLWARLKSFFGEETPPEVDAIVTPTTIPEGVTYEWAGFRSMADPATNSDAWLKYSETQAARSWIGSPRYMNPFVKPGKEIESAEEFEEFKRQVRAAPETNDIVDMRAFLKARHAQLSAEFGIYHALGINVINATGPKDWPDTLQDDFVNWAGCYALTYYLAKNHGVVAHQYGNEPDPFFNKSTDEQIARRLTLVADAVHCAIEDVNRDFKRDLKAVFSAPVLASDFTGRTARIMMRNLYTRYDGSKSPTPLFQLFNRHRYGGRPHQNALEVRQAKQMMQEEAGEVLPQVFTELNYSTGGNWARPNITFLNDTPTVFTSIAGLWGWMMQEQGVHGIFVFKLNDPGVWSRPGTGPFSNTITYSMFPEQDAGATPAKKEQISYGSKNFEVSRLFGRGFHGSRPLLQTEVSCSDPEYRAWTTYAEDEGRYYVWSVQVDQFAGYEVEFDLGRLDLPPGALVTAETVSGARHGEMTLMLDLPENRKIRLRQPPQSALLLTAHQRPAQRETIYPEADATVIQGTQAGENFGKDTSLQVGRNGTSGANQISFLKFKLPEATSGVQRAVLELHGQSRSAQAYDGGFLVRVYAVEKADWNEDGITAENAPLIYKTVSGLQKIDLENYPAGHVTCFATPSRLMIDVTRVVQEARKTNREELDFVLIREINWPGENTDDVSAVFSSREDGQELSPKLYVWE